VYLLGHSWGGFRPEGVPLPAGYIALRDEAMHRLGMGTMREVSSADRWRGKRFSAHTGRGTTCSAPT
jgi:hypothetical protein